MTPVKTQKYGDKPKKCPQDVGMNPMETHKNGDESNGSPQEWGRISRVHKNGTNPMNTHKIGFSAKNAKFSQTAGRLSAYPGIYWKSVL